MYNHARTLLMNLPGENNSFFADCPGDQLIPTEFKSVRLPSYLEVIRSRIFGVAPDRLCLNYRSHQLLQILEANAELQQYVLALDPRITYRLNEETSLLGINQRAPLIYPHGMASAQVLQLQGQPVPADVLGRSAFEHTVTVVDGVTLRIELLTTVTGGPTAEEHAISLTNGLSNKCPLPNTGYGVRVTQINPGDSWTVRGTLPLRRSLQEIEQQLRGVGGDNMLSLFGVGSEEPYLSFRNLWENHVYLPARLGGLVLALIYRTEEVRRAQYV